jgi:NTP pyrophosphatase (non-canonical NTP hydrolase)
MRAALRTLFPTLARREPKPAVPTPQPKAPWHDPRNPLPVPLALQAPVELDHDLITGAFSMIGHEAHRQARASGFWANIDPKRALDLWAKIALVVEELGEAGRALREGRLTTTPRLASKSENEKGGIYQVEVEGFVDEVADIVLRCADACAAAELDLGAAIIRKLYKNRRRAPGHGGREF